MRVGILGLGAMGTGMAANLARSEHETWVWNRTRSVAEVLAQDCAVQVAVDPQDLASRVEVILTCVSADADVMAVVETICPVLRSGQVIVDTSTIKASTAEALAELVRESGARFLDGPVSGGKEGAKNGTLSMMVGGEIDALEQVRPVLEVITGRITHMGLVGSGQKTKAVNQVMAAGINQAVSEALAFAHAMNLPLEKVLEVVSSGAAGNWFVTHRGPSMIENRFIPGFKLALHDKDLGICQQLAEQCGGTLPVVDQTREDYRVLMQNGQGEQDISALYSLKQGLFRHQD